MGKYSLVMKFKNRQAGREQEAENLGMSPLSSLAAQGCPLPHPLGLSPGAPCSFCIAHCVFCELAGQGFGDSSCEVLVSIFPRQSQKLWEVMRRLSMKRMRKAMVSLRLLKEQ